MKGEDMAGPLYNYVADMLEIESLIAEALGRLSGLVENQVEVSNTIGKFRAMAKSQRDRLEERLKSITDGDPQAATSTNSASTTVSGPVDPSTRISASTALQELYAAFSRAAFGYGMLHTRTHRFFDGTPDGSTGDMAQQHLRAYREAAQEIFEMVPDSAIWELDQEGQPYICTCPSCTLGICLCRHTHADDHAGDVDDRGIRIRTPKPESEAERIGLRDDDTVLAVDSQTIESYQDVNPLLNKHGSGDKVILQIQRKGGASFEVTARRP